MNLQQLTKARRVIRQHYGLHRAVTEREAWDEVANLRRKQAEGNLDDMDERLVAALSVGKFAIKL